MKVKRLLSDFTHVSDDHAKDGSWLGQDRDPRSACLNCDPTRSADPKICWVHGSLGQDSQMYPFANLTFDQMVETYLPRAKEIFQTGDLNEWKKERMAVSV